MKKGPLLLVSVVLLLSFWGCTRPETISMGVIQGGDPNYRAKRVYSIDLPQAWDLSLQALRENRIPIENADPSTSVMRTGYQVEPGLSRYKCDLHFLPEPGDKTYIQVRCTYEMKNDVKEAYRDLTYSMSKEAMIMEEGVYKKIEPYLLPAEQIRVAKEVASSQAKPPIPPSVTVEESPSKPEGILAKPPEAEVQPPKSEEAIPKPMTVETPSKKTEIVPVPPPSIATPMPKLQTPPPKVLLPLSSKPTIIAKGFTSSLAQAESKEEEGEKATGVFLVTKRNAKMREEPSSTSRVMVILKKGRKVEKIGELGPWTNVKLSWGDTGWVLNSLLGKPY